MAASPPPAPICAIVRAQPREADALLAEVAARAKAAGLRLAGVLQREVPRPGRTKCDILLSDLSSGAEVRISEDRGLEAAGCRLDHGALTEAAARVEAAIRVAPPDLMILNKFALAEEEGGGLRDAIAAALGAGTPVLMGVAVDRVAALEAFAGDYCQIIAAGRGTVEGWLSDALGQRWARAAPPQADEAPAAPG